MDVRLVSDVLDLAVALTSATLALLVLAVAPRARVNRLLALYLVLNAATSNQRSLPLDPTLAYNLRVLNTGAWLGIAFAYLAFTSQAVDAPWLRPLRHRVAHRGLLVAALVPLPLAFLFHASLLVPVRDGWDIIPPLLHPLRLVSLATVLTALAASLHAFARATPGTVARRRAAAYAVAFGLQDATLAVNFILGNEGPWVESLIGLGLMASLVLLAVALLRFQLFDFALRVKFGVQRGTLAAIFLATFFVVAEATQSYLSDNVGYVAGGVAAGLLVFALRPLERLANRVADTAMPRVDATPTYLAYKKLEVYRAAVESALENDGRIDASERDLLNRLRAKLGLQEGDARAIEAEVADARPTPA